MIVFLVMLAVWIVVVAGFVFSLCWAARGESDVNGDPERDSGEET